MSYIALYRKFRPQTFEQIKGQDHVVTALRNQLIQGRIGHAYLFTGTRGTGKTSAAKILAKAVNCLNLRNGEPCNECENCLSVNAGSFVDVVEVDAASNNGVDDIRRIIEDVRYTPVRGTYKVFIIDEAHMITGAAFNAFLKTLEEPPAYAVFILATTEPHKLPITILSRCQRYDFKRITTDQIAGNLGRIVREEGVEAEDKALRYVARLGDGSMRDAISLLDKCIAFNLGNALTYDNVLETLGTVDTEVFSRLFGSITQGDVLSVLQTIDRVSADGRDLTQFITEFIRYIRNLLMIQAADLEDPDVLGISRENMDQMLRDRNLAGQEVLIRYIRVLSELLNRIRYASNKQILIETSMIQLARPQMETDLSSLADRIRQLEQKIGEGMPLPQVQQPQPVRSAAPEGPDEEYYSGTSIPDSMLDPNVFADLMDSLAPQFAPQFEPQYEPQYEPQFEPQSMAASPMPQTAAPFEAREPAPAPSGPASGGSGLWPRLVDGCRNIRIRTALKKCTATETEHDGVCQLNIQAPGIVIQKQLREDAVLESLQQLASSVAGRTVNIQIIQGDEFGTSQNPQGNFPEELLSRINMKIGTEEY